MRFAFDAFVTAALIVGDQVAFALGDGRVAWSDGAQTVAHEGAILAAAVHPAGDGVITGGDDGRLVVSRPGESRLLAELPGAWIDQVAASPVSGLIAFAAGRGLHVRDVADPAFARSFEHERSVAGLAFDGKGRRLASATYGGVLLWWARIARQKPVSLRWAGSHIAAAFSPDGRFVVSAMQENAVHGWRLSDSRDMRMGGYPSKVKSLAFGGDWLATSGANGVVLWPFAGSDGPMGRQAMEIGFDEATLVARVAADGPLLAAGLQDGRVWACHTDGRAIRPLESETGAPISALAVGGDRIAWGDEAGAAGAERFTG